MRSRATGMRSLPTCAATARAPGSRRATGFPTTSPISRRCSTPSPRAKRRRWSATAWAATSCCTTPACGRSACAPWCRSTASASRPRTRSLAPAKFRAWLDAQTQPAEFAPYASIGHVAARLRKNNRRLTDDRALFLAAALGRGAGGRLGAARCRIRATSCRSRPSIGSRKCSRSGARSKRRCCGWPRADSTIPQWLDGAQASDGGTDPLAGVRRRLAHIANGRLQVVADAGHMLQHDQPAAVAAAIEPFLAAGR